MISTKEWFFSKDK